MLGISSSNLNDGLRSNHVLLARPQTQRRKKQQAGPFFLFHTTYAFVPLYKMLPCSSSAQMEGCEEEEERGARMQTEVRGGGDSVKRLKYFCFFRAQFIVTVHIESL